jgi:hypothetical protein
MLTVGIAIDGWKLEIFERHLKRASYAFSKGKPLTAGTVLLKVETTNVEALAEVINAAYDEAARTGEPS